MFSWNNWNHSLSKRQPAGGGRAPAFFLYLNKRTETGSWQVVSKVWLIDLFMGDRKNCSSQQSAGLYLPDIVLCATEQSNDDHISSPPTPQLPNEFLLSL